MVQISKRKVPERISLILFQLLFEVMGKKFREDEFANILNDLFSETEKIMLIKRIGILYLLLKEKDRETICDVLKVSPGTVSKFAIFIHRESAIVKALKRILQNEKLAELFEDVFSFFFPPMRYGKNWSQGLKDEYMKKLKRKIGI